MKALYDATGVATTAGPGTQGSEEQSEQGGEDKQKNAKGNKISGACKCFCRCLRYPRVEGAK